MRSKLKYILYQLNLAFSLAGYRNLVWSNFDWFIEFASSIVLGLWRHTHLELWPKKSVLGHSNIFLSFGVKMLSSEKKHYQQLVGSLLTFLLSYPIKWDYCMIPFLYKGFALLCCGKRRTLKVEFEWGSPTPSKRFLFFNKEWIWNVTSNKILSLL